MPQFRGTTDPVVITDMLGNQEYSKVRITVGAHSPRIDMESQQ
jgi:hypothetical protein